ncbi:DUF1302 domain-containing protein [Pseudomonas citronellolis]|uniref:DUF1302 domain-containing protein n=1 Tax=Pseudomonas citronellolis TaxID=53408 RepID=UPI0009F40AA4|nr:DUF1302 domain-containing protein [Pseudomonas humi]
MGFERSKQIGGGFAVKSIAARLFVLLCGVGAVESAKAFVIDTDNPDIKIRWDNTVSYTAGWRIKNPDSAVASQNGNQPNVDYGDLSFDKGLINNRFDLLSEFDFSYKNVGVRTSGAAWYDDVYNKSHTDYPGGAPNTQADLDGGAQNVFPGRTKQLMGHYAELADAFVYGKFDFGERSLNLRAGRHTTIYGETLFLGGNGIAAAQGPVDLVKAQSLPNVQFKEIAMPVTQLSGSFSITPEVSVGAYYQLEWRKMRVPPAGSYFSAADPWFEGGDLALLPPHLQSIDLGPGGVQPLYGSFATRGKDYKGDDSGQFGGQIKIKVGDIDFGLYAARYDDKAPIPVINLTTAPRFLGGPVPTYNIMYAKGISVFGASASTVIGETNVAAEISTRRNVPLVVPGDLIINSSVPNADNDRHTPYARGNSLHANLSAISVYGGNALWDGASLVGEFAFNRLLSVTHRPAYDAANGAPDPLNSTHTRDSGVMRAVFTPEFFQVMPNVDLQVPIGLGYGLFGRSAVVQLAPEHGGDFSLGVNANIEKTWKVGLNYVHYFGGKGSAPSDATNIPVSTYASYDQYYHDRDFVAFTVQRTF